MDEHDFEYDVDENGRQYVFCTHCGAEVSELELNQHECEGAEEFCTKCGAYHSYSEAECENRQAEWFVRAWEQAEIDAATMTPEEQHEQWLARQARMESVDRGGPDYDD